MRVRAAGLALLFAGAPLRVHAQTTDVALGIEALARRDVRGAEAAFARASIGSNVALRATAYQWRGHVAWKIRGDTAAAVRYLNEALATARDSSMVLLEIARLSGARNRYREATRTAFEAMTRSVDGERRGLAARTLVALAVDGAFAARARDTRDSLDIPTLITVRDTLAARVARFPGRTVDALALLDAGALLADGTTIGTAWHSYFALADSATQEGLAYTAKTMSQESRTFRTPAAPNWAWSGVAANLVNSGLSEEAALLARSASHGAELPAFVSDVDAYAVFARRVKAASEAHYRRALLGRARDGDINRAIAQHGRTLWQTLRANDARSNRALRPADTLPEFYPGALLRELPRRFGTVLSVERSGGIEELHFAHRIGVQTVRAGSRSGILVTLDGVVASGIDEWLLDGAGGRAGWVARDTMFMRRTGFTETPFRAWLALADPQSMPAELFRLARDSVGDFERARRDSLGFLPGVAARMFRDGATAIFDSLNAIETMTDADRERAFAKVMFDNLERTSILLHEGRHLADARAGRTGAAAEDELRAKVDEVTGAPHPRLALTAILSPNIGDGSSHGLANRRIMLGLVRWIRANGNAIAAYDAAAPALLQLPRLSDAQLRAAFESMRRP